MRAGRGLRIPHGWILQVQRRQVQTHRRPAEHPGLPAAAEPRQRQARQQRHRKQKQQNRPSCGPHPHRGRTDRRDRRPLLALQQLALERGRASCGRPRGRRCTEPQAPVHEPRRTPGRPGPRRCPGDRRRTGARGACPGKRNGRVHDHHRAHRRGVLHAPVPHPGRPRRALSGRPERRSSWGTQRYVYNHRNPSGTALILITAVVTIGVVIGFHSGSQWRRLRPVVRSCV